MLLGSSLLVLPSVATPVKAQTGPSISLSTTSGPPGTVLTVSGSGFASDTTEFKIDICCRSVAGVQTPSAPFYCPANLDGSGTFSCDYGILWNSDAVTCALSLIPGQPPGTSGKLGCVLDLINSAIPFPPGKVTVEADGEIGVANKAIHTYEPASAPFPNTTPSISLSSGVGARGSQVSIT